MELHRWLRKFPSLADSDLFRNISPEAIKNTRGRCFLCSLEPGQVLIQAGHPNNTLFLLLEGRLRVQLEPAMKPVARIRPGEFVGELSLIDGQPASATVVADLACRLLMIPGEVVWSMARTSPITRNLLCTLAGQLRHKNDLLVTSQRLLDECQHHATTDSLTGLRNRRWLDAMLLRQVERSGRDRSPCALLLIDVDSLKKCNDEQGHLIGDYILQTLARILEDNLRPGEIMARFGGDEFVVLLPQTEGDKAREIARRLCRAVASRGPGTPSPGPRITVSIGVARLGPSDGPQEFMARADRSLYQAKAGGGNRVGPLAAPEPEASPRPGQKGVPA